MPVICPYCGKDAPRVTGKEVYPHRPDLQKGWFYACFPCGAWVGTHRNGNPLGTLANADLRRARTAAHKVFDPLWRDNPNLSRTKAYEWLSKAMGTLPEQTHIALFDVNQCQQVVALCARLRAEMKEKSRAD